MHGYSGKCRGRTEIPARQPSSLAWRFRAEDPSGNDDFIVARTAPLDGDLPKESGFCPAYHWACAIDDYDSDVRLVVRAVDLESAVPVQRAIQRWLAETEKRPIRFAAIFHCALVVRDDGHRLEKRTRGVTLPELMEGKPSAAIALAALLERLEKSFDRSLLGAPFQSGAIIGEERTRITVSELW